MIIEKDILIYMFDIVEFYPNSDFLISKVFKIISNIFNAKNDDVQDMVRYLIEDTQLIPFLLKHGPKVTGFTKAVVPEPKSPEIKTET